jgi:hypothetical protein
MISWRRRKNFAMLSTPGQTLVARPDREAATHHEEEDGVDHQQGDDPRLTTELWHGGWMLESVAFDEDDL